jgi:phenylpropionate dioxygenase-like ring-hydroxylating dioxygenase large terminal subunit
MKPTGWFQFGWSSTVPACGVVALRFFGQDLVAWRDSTGEVHLLDAYCKHLGANLGHGGCVVDAGLQCPFHGWVWDADGRNVSIPYEDRPNAAQRIRSWPVVECNEVLYLWHNLDDEPPSFDVPDFTGGLFEQLQGVTFQRALPDGTSHFQGLQVHPQYVVENAVDCHHFRFVHGTAASPVILREEVSASSWRTVAGFGRRWADGIDRPGDRGNTITIHWVGVGFAFNAEHTPEGWRVILIATTPVDDDSTEMFGTYWLEDGAPAAAGKRAELLDLIKSALPQDIGIWNNQQYLDRPALGKSEVPGFMKLRRWTSTFYPDVGAPARATT